MKWTTDSFDASFGLTGAYGSGITLMAWAQIHWRSEILSKETTLQVLLPKVGEPPFPTLYLLHSLGDDSLAWLRRTRLERYVRDYPLLVVMPDGYRGFFTDNEEGPQYGKHIGEEVLAFVERNFPARSARNARAIGGMSMGGYGALHIGLSYPDKFCSIHSNAGSLDRRVDFSVSAEEQQGILSQRPDSFIAEMRRVFGARPTDTKRDVLKLAVEAHGVGTLPQLWLDCGTEDYLLEGTRLFHRDLEEAGVPHVYREMPGTHNWDYCDAQLETVLAFHAKNLGITAQESLPSTVG